MNNVAISPKIFMYTLQNQNVERKIARPIKTAFTKEENQNDSTLIDELTNNQEIPEILIPKDEPEPLPRIDLFRENIINNDNLVTSVENNQDVSTL